MKLLKKDGTPDKRHKKDLTHESQAMETSLKPSVQEIQIETAQNAQEEPKSDPQTLFNNLLEANNIQLDFDVLEGTIATKLGIIKLDKPTLVVKASYVPSK